MCPLCISTTALTIAFAGATSTGGFIAFLAHRFNRKKGEKNHAEENRVSR